MNGLSTLPSSAPNPQWKRSSCGLSPSTSSWGTQRAEMFSGSSCARSTARRTCCSGWPVKTSNRKSTRASLRRKRAPSMKTTFPYYHQKRWDRHCCLEHVTFKCYLASVSFNPYDRWSVTHFSFLSSLLTNGMSCHTASGGCRLKACVIV